MYRLRFSKVISIYLTQYTKHNTYPPEQYLLVPKVLACDMTEQPWQIYWKPYIYVSSGHPHCSVSCQNTNDDIIRATAPVNPAVKILTSCAMNTFKPNAGSPPPV